METMRTWVDRQGAGGTAQVVGDCRLMAWHVLYVLRAKCSSRRGLRRVAKQIHAYPRPRPIFSRPEYRGAARRGGSTLERSQGVRVPQNSRGALMPDTRSRA